MAAPLTTLTPQTHRARAIVAPIDRDRLIVAEHDGGARQEDIAARVGVSQPTVSRVLRHRDRIRSTPPSALELICRHTLGELDHAALMETLRSRRYGPTTGGAADTRIEASWTDVEQAALAGLLADADYRTLAADVARSAAPVPDDPVVVYDTMRETATRLTATLRDRHGATAARPEIRAVRDRVAAVDPADLEAQKALTRELHEERERLAPSR